MYYQHENSYSMLAKFCIDVVLCSALIGLSPENPGF